MTIVSQAAVCDHFCRVEFCGNAVEFLAYLRMDLGCPHLRGQQVEIPLGHRDVDRFQQRDEELMAGFDAHERDMIAEEVGAWGP